MSVNSANEYWVKTGSLVHTDTAGNDIADPHERALLPAVRRRAHRVRQRRRTRSGVCAQPRNTIDPSPALRALLVAMDQWIDGTRAADERGAARVRRHRGVLDDDGEFAARHRRRAAGSLGWPTIPGVTYTGLITSATCSTSARSSTTASSSMTPPHRDRQGVSVIRLEGRRRRGPCRTGCTRCRAPARRSPAPGRPSGSQRSAAGA